MNKSEVELYVTQKQIADLRDLVKNVRTLDLQHPSAKQKDVKKVQEHALELIDKLEIRADHIRNRALRKIMREVTSEGNEVQGEGLPEHTQES